MVNMKRCIAALALLLVAGSAQSAITKPDEISVVPDPLNYANRTGGMYSDCRTVYIEGTYDAPDSLYPKYEDGGKTYNFQARTFYIKPINGKIGIRLYQVLADSAAADTTQRMYLDPSPTATNRDFWCRGAIRLVEIWSLDATGDSAQVCSD